MSDDANDAGEDSGSGGDGKIEQGLRAYAAGDVLSDVLDSLDVEALADGATFEEAVEYEEFGEAIGRLAGYAAARGTSSTGLAGRVIRSEVASEVGGKAGKAAGAAFVEHGDPDALLNSLRIVADRTGLNQVSEQLAAATEGRSSDAVAAEDGPTDPSEWTEIDIEDGTEN